MVETTRKALLLVNSHSRNGQDADAYVQALSAGGLAFDRRECPKREELGALVRSVRGEVDCVVMAGGDGTVSAAAPCLRETGLPLGILPLGTANDLARTIGVPTEPEAAARIILAGKTRAIDLGSVNGQLFFNVASMGLTVDISRRLTKAAKRRLGKLAYAWTAMRVVLRSGRFSAEIRSGNATHRVRTMQIAVGNGRFYGGGMVVSAGAAIDDQMLDVYSLELRSKWRLLLSARAFTEGEHDDIDEVWTMRAADFEVTTKKPQPISADGEIVTSTPARFGVVPQAVTVYVP